MRVYSFLTTALMMFGITGPLRAADDFKDGKEEDDSVAKVLSQIAQLGQGVHKIKTDKHGHIISCVVVGQSRISTVLGNAKGLETARDRADLAAKAAFAKWLKEKVSVHHNADDELILFLEGTEANDREALNESGKSVEKTSKKMESISEALIRGMQPLHIETSEKDKTYTLVYGWDREIAEATKKMREDLREDSPTKQPEAKADEKKPGDGTASRNADKKIEDKKATSKDARKFVD